MASRRKTTLIIVLISLLVVLGGVIVFQFRDQIFTAVGVAESQEGVTASSTDPQSGFTWNITKSASVGQVNPGDSATYTIEWEILGQGSSFSNIVTDDYDQSAIASIASLGGGAVDNGDTIVWDLGTLDLTSGSASGSLSYTATFRDASDPLLPTLPHDATNTVSLVSIDPNGSESDSATVTVLSPVVDPPTAAPELAIVKNVEDLNGDVVRRGDDLRYSIALENIGQATSTGILVTDNVGPYLENFTVESFPTGATNSSTASGGTNGTGFLSISDFNLTPGTGTLITYTVTVMNDAPDGQSIPNIALASDEQGNDVQDDANVTVLVETPPIEVLEETIIPDDPTTPVTTSRPTPIAQSGSSSSSVITPSGSTSTTQEVVVPETGIDPRAAVWVIFAILSALGIALYVWYVLKRVLR